MRRKKKMRANDHVVLLRDPLSRGIGVILEAGKSGRLWIEWDYLDEEGSGAHRSWHNAHEVETEAVYYGRAPQAFSTLDFEALRRDPRKGKST